MVLMAYVDTRGSDRDVVWYIDSGCSNHMCGDSSLFCELEEGFNKVVRLGNYASMNVVGKGSVRLTIKGVNHLVRDVYYVPGLKNNLLSVGQLQEKGLAILMQSNEEASLRYNPKRSTWRASTKLELVHTDICGPISPSSEGNKRYFIYFIDDYSRKAWVYFLAYKSDVFTIFKLFKALVEKEKNLPIKCLRTDRGGEFTSDEFKEYCEMNGIKRQLTAAYTPQQNGVAERKNRTVMNMVRSLLIEKNVPRKFWAEAPSVERLRVFGYLTHAHVLDARRTKLEAKSRCCVFFGASEETKAHRLYDPTSKKIIISRDVVFEEDGQWIWEKSSKEDNMFDLDWEDEKSEERDDSSNDTGEENADDGSEETSPEIEPRNRRASRWMNDYIPGECLSDEEEEEQTHLVLFAHVVHSDPTSFDEAVTEEKWRTSMDVEIKSIEKNRMWDLMELPKGAKKIGVKWVYKTKLNELGEVEKCKARLVAKGYAQEYGIEYKEVYAPVARMDTVRMILALAVQRGWSVFQLDVKSAFLHEKLAESVYVEQPRGYEIKNEEHKVYKLNKVLYGLKQAPRAWFSRIESYFRKEGFEKEDSEQTLFTKVEQGKYLIISLYVDDLIFTGNDEKMMVKFKESMMKEFDMSDLGKMRYFLGIEVVQLNGGIFISQTKYVMEVLRRFGMEYNNFVENPMVPGFKISKDENGIEMDDSFFQQLIGSLMYLTVTRPDIMYAVSLLSSDYAGSVEDKRSTSGYVFMLSGAAVAWSSRKQPIVTLSTTEAEFVAAAGSSCQAIWMQRVLRKLGYRGNETTVIFCDNSSTIKLSKNPVMHGRNKHIDVRYHFLRELVNDGIVQLQFCAHAKLQRLLLHKSKVGFDKLNDALVVFDQMLHTKPLPNAIDFNQLLAALLRMKHHSVALSVFRVMCLETIPLNVVTFNTVINCFCHLNRVDYAFSLLAAIIKRGFLPDLFTEVDEALAVLQTMKTRGVVPNICTYNILINGYCKKLKVDRAIDLFQQLPHEGLPPTIETYNTILQGYFITGRHVEARNFFKEKMMLNKGLKLDMVTCNIMLDGLFKHRYKDEAMSFFHLTQCNGLPPHIHTYNILINGLCKNGNFEKAKNIFESLPSKDLRPNCTPVLPMAPSCVIPIHEAAMEEYILGSRNTFWDLVTKLHFAGNVF
ncbi:hypothetical protein AgCh_001157 [Apium graveolens]